MDKAAFIKAGKSKPKKIASAPHLVVRALAGCGKTTTGIESLKALKGLPFSPGFKPSKQQAAIIDSILLSNGALSIYFIAFAKKIATVLEQRVPPGVVACTAHKFGFKAIAQAFDLRGGRDSVNDERTREIMAEIAGVNIEDIWDNLGPNVVSVTERLVDLVKMNLANTDPNSLDEIADYHQLDVNGDRDSIYELVPQVLERAKRVEEDGQIDFADMIWLPIALDLPIQRNDLLLVDEFQDLNRCQQELMKRAGKRIIGIGDPNQAIFGFAGADCESMDRMQADLADSPEGCDTLPLTETRRCCKAVVRLAQKLVSDFTAHESNEEGAVNEFHIDSSKFNDTLVERLQSRDMAICRVNAPLVSLCFKLVKAGKRAEIQGKDIGDGLIRLIKKLKARDVVSLTTKLEDWHDRELKKLASKKRPSEAAIIAHEDRYSCAVSFIEGAKTVNEVLASIAKVFSDTPKENAILLTSAHKSKGLEADRVFILLPEGVSMPHPMARTAWAVKQEFNLIYVSQTRAIKELNIVS